jgi:hypothetical protein
MFHLMKRLSIFAACCGLLFALGGCLEASHTNRSEQAERAATAANSLRFNSNAEIDNIKHRLELTSQPGLAGYILLMNEAIKGKITSGSKRLTEPMQRWSNGNGGAVVAPAPSDEGTWGSSNEYIYYWTAAGEYRQWNGKYLYSDKPFRIRIEPLVISEAPKP